MNTPSRRSTRSTLARLAVALLLTSLPTPTLAADTPPGPSILQDLKNFRETGRVLYVAAHPDDENTQLITYLARGRHYRTAYLSLTRGDGGQNVIGPEFGAELGLIRTHELLAARHLDGGQQFFTRALDFGFSKSADETLKVWDRQQVLADVVRVIRTFRPDVMVTRFSPTPGGTHGHHTSSAILAVEAFKLAGDPNAFPDQLHQGLTPWQPKRILQNGRGGAADGLQIDVSGDDPVLNEPFARIASRSRGMHKSQGFGSFGGGGGDRGARSESFTLLAGEPATRDILDGVDTTWSRFQGAADITALADAAISRFNPQDPAATVPALLDLKSRLAQLSADPVIAEKQKAVDHLLQSCLGLTVQTVLPRAEVVPGESLQLTHTVNVHSALPVRWLATRYPTIRGEAPGGPLDLQRDRTASRQSTPVVPANTAPTQPYWLHQDPSAGTFHVDEPRLIGLPENPPVFPVEHVFEISGQTFTVPDQPIAASTATTQPYLAHPLEVIPPVFLHPTTEVRLFTPGSSKPIDVEITASRADTSGTLKLDAPPDWKIEPTTQPFHLTAAGDKVKLSFTVTAPPAPAQSTTAPITAVATVHDHPFDTDRVEINYPHIPPLLLQPKARVKAVTLDLATRGKTVGYLPGAGDNVAESLEEMGYTVTRLSGPDLTPDNLKKFDAVVVGVRAFNVRDDLANNVQSLFAYAEAGGTVIVQYNRPNGLKTDKLAPYDLKLSNDRRTRARHLPRPRPPRAQHPQQNHPERLRRLDPGTRHLLPQPVGPPLHPHPRHQRPQRTPAQRQPPHRPPRQRLLRLHRPRLLPPTPRRQPRRLPPLRQPRLLREMK